VRLAALVLGALALTGCGGDDEEESAATTAPAATTAAAGGPCRDVAEPRPRTPPPGRAPAAILSSEKTYDLVFRTSCGAFTVRLDLNAAPRTTASLVALAEADYFDGTFFHRIVPAFVIQGGDPTGTGTGGPGYSTVDAPAPDTAYTKGVMAMAKTAAEAAGTSGSQFFVVTADDAGLPADYAVVGKVVDGLDVVDLIGTLGDPNTELPTLPVVVEDVVVRVR
jgi:cyclophilin family peptidyl-prolyl cis-trans isomerase